MTQELIILDEKTIKDKMYYIRGQYVMIDSDLAKIYGYTTKAFNQQVKNNIEKFDEDFMFKLTNDEVKILSRSKKLTLNKIERGHNIKYNPYAFTEQGIYMLMTVLKGEKAIEQSKALIRIFKSMKDYLVDNYNKQYNNLTIKYNNTFHDRYFILDRSIIYHCGTSLNHMGNKTFSINILSDQSIIDTLLNKVKCVI